MIQKDPKKTSVQATQKTAFRTVISLETAISWPSIFRQLSVMASFFVVVVAVKEPRLLAPLNIGFAKNLSRRMGQSLFNLCQSEKSLRSTLIVVGLSLAFFRARVTYLLTFFLCIRPIKRSARDCGESFEAAYCCQHSFPATAEAVVKVASVK